MKFNGVCDIILIEEVHGRWRRLKELLVIDDNIIDGIVIHLI